MAALAGACLSLEGGSGGSGGTGAAGAAGGMGGMGAGVPCSTDADCADTPCRTGGTCTDGSCVFVSLMIGDFPPEQQIYGDCMTKQCDEQGNYAEVAKDSDVYDFSNPCIVDNCSQGTTVKAESLGAPCQRDGATGFCDGKLRCAQCYMDSQCGAMVCGDGYCVSQQCANGTLDGDETGIDCGGSCAPCPDGQACLGFSDCRSRNCDMNVCFSDCTDGVQNGDETDTDCGGTCGTSGTPTSTCDTGKKCVVPGDCTSGKCQAGVCVP
jgi:hypothetical protein